MPVVCGPMYPGSNPELVAAVSEAGGFGVVQPIALTRLYGHDYRAGLKRIKELTDKPFGVNITILPNTAAAAKYRKMNDEFLDIALDEGINFILTSLGKPNDIVKKVHAAGGKVYHDVHTPKIALQAAAAGVDGLNLLNSSMGGQTGAQTANEIISCSAAINAARGMTDNDFPFLCAGGVATAGDLEDKMEMGYAGAQCGTRFLASEEAIVTKEYKQAIVEAGELFCGKKECCLRGSTELHSGSHASPSLPFSLG